MHSNVQSTPTSSSSSVQLTFCVRERTSVARDLAMQSCSAMSISENELMMPVAGVDAPEEEGVVEGVLKVVWHGDGWQETL